MKFSNVRLLVRDYEKCFRFYTEKLGLEAAFEVHCAAISNSSIGLHGVEVQVAQDAIVLRSSGKMTVGANWGWVEGCITVPLV